MVNAEKIACSPIIGDYHIITDILMERCLNYKTMACPPMTKRTIEIGSRNSPDMICTPFKLTLGNFIEAAEQGANVFVMPGAGCRLGFYDILQKQILSDLGYDIEMLVLFDKMPTVKRLYKSLSEANPNLSLDDFGTVMDTVVRITLDMDKLADYLRKNMAFEVNKGEYESLYKAYLNEARNAQNAAEAEDIGIKYKKKLESVETNKPDRPIRIGIIGETYAIVEPFLNCYLEKWLAEHEVEIIRPVDLTSMVHAIYNVNDIIAENGGYAVYNIGSTANKAIALAYKMINDKIDGIIHIKPASCPPEITAMTSLQNMSSDHGVPIMYLTFDTETSEAGLHTRLEAFHDMITMRRLK